MLAAQVEPISAARLCSQLANEGVQSDDIDFVRHGTEIRKKRNSKKKEMMQGQDPY